MTPKVRLASGRTFGPTGLPQQNPPHCPYLDDVDTAGPTATATMERRARARSVGDSDGEGRGAGARSPGGKVGAHRAAWSEESGMGHFTEDDEASSLGVPGPCSRGECVVGVGEREERERERNQHRQSIHVFCCLCLCLRSGGSAPRKREGRCFLMEFRQIKGHMAGGLGEKRERGKGE